MSKAASKALIGNAMDALIDRGERVRGVWLRPGGDVIILTDEVVTRPISGDELDNELTEFMAKNGYN